MTRIVTVAVPASAAPAWVALGWADLGPASAWHTCIRDEAEWQAPMTLLIAILTRAYLACGPSYECSRVVGPAIVLVGCVVGAVAAGGVGRSATVG